MKPHTLYRFFGADDVLLYVGITADPGRRLHAHRSQKDWWESVARVTMEHFENREALVAAEREAIKSERPRHNIVHNGSVTTLPTTTTIASFRPTCDNCGSVRGRTQFAGDEIQPICQVCGWHHEWFEPLTVVGRWFHSLNDNGERQWQGCVLSRDGDLCLVQLFSWWDGTASDQVLVSIEDMRAWCFFSSSEEMRERAEVQA